MTFLNNEYKPEPIVGNYTKFDEGDNKLRILSDAITGWEYWVEDGSNRKPVRLKEMPEEVPAEASKDKYGGYIKEFWAFVVWSYKVEKIQICQITQATIKEQIFELHSSEEWGDPKQYNITIGKKIEGDRTSYSVVPSPPTDISTTIAEAVASKPINLEALYSGQDPFEIDEDDIKI